MGTGSPKRRFAAALLAGLLALALAGPAKAATLRAGVATADITPENGGTTLGYVRPEVFVEGVHTRLTGRVLVLADGDTKVVLLGTDLAFALDKDSLVARVADLGYTHESILYTGTHTHSGPGSLTDWQLEQLAGAIRSADANLVPVRAAWGRAEVGDVNRNRSIEAHLANHAIEQFYGQGRPEDDPRGVAHTRDTTLRVLRVERRDGSPLAAWMNFPVHLTTSTPAVDVWDADLAAPAQEHLGEAVGGRGFMAMFTNGASGDLMPTFESFNPTALMDRHGRRIALGAKRAWTRAGRRLSRRLAVDVRWTRSCYCGQEVEPGRRVSSVPLWGLAFFGGSEDGASIFHEPASTEGRRLPAAASHPVHGRKIIVSEGLVHETIPEVHAIRIGDRLLLGAPGEPSVEMARRFVRAVKPLLPDGVRDPFLVGLANDYMGYLTTPAEYDMQHYEGGHTVFGLWTSLLVRNTFVELTRAMAQRRPSPEPAEPAELGGTSAGESPLGDGGVDGRLLEAPRGRVRRMTSARVRWEGAPEGVDRPLDDPFLILERRAGGAWKRADSDLGLAFLWREQDGRYGALYDFTAEQRLGRYRFRVSSGSYDLETPAFELAPSRGLRVRGVLLRRRGDRSLLVVRAQNPRPDTAEAILWRPKVPRGGAAAIRAAGEKLRARWSAKRRAWVAAAPAGLGTGDRVTVKRLRDGEGNRIAGPARVRVGKLEKLRWPPNMAVGGGRTPGPFGEGEFPP